VSTARRLCLPAAVLVAAFLAATVVVAVDRNERGALGPAIAGALGVAAIGAAVVFVFARRSGPAFVMTALTAVGYVATIFTGLYPRVLVSHPSFENSLTVSSASSGHYALVVITVVAAIFLPVILLYQGWTYHVFRARLGGEDPGTPVDAIERTTARLPSG